MPYAGAYRQRAGDPVQAIQFHPSAKRDAIERFCPNIQYHGGIDFPQEGRPVGTTDRLFSIDGQYGALYDWIVYEHGHYQIVPEADFARLYETA